MNCPCQSGKEYDACCGRFISQRMQAENAEQLMRSRYSAYVLHQADYLAATWHADFRSASLALDDVVTWLRLDVLNSAHTGDCANVEFEARCLVDGRVEALHELSRFVFAGGRWLYTDGDLLKPSFVPWKPGRNEPCPCGSGAKFKRCCAC
jgi:SEC-C motif-containing protein